MSTENRRIGALRALARKKREAMREVRKAQALLDSARAYKAAQTRKFRRENPELVRLQKQLREAEVRNRKLERELAKQRKQEEFDNAYHFIQKHKGRIKRQHGEALQVFKGSKGSGLEEAVDRLWLEFADFDIYEDVGDIFDLYADPYSGN